MSASNPAEVAAAAEAFGIPEDVARLAGTRYLLIRHGHSWSQAEGIITGHDTCGGLSDLGRDQVARLADRLSRTGELDDATVFQTSLYARARATAAAIAPSLDGSATFTEHCAWCEQHPGTADGRDWSWMLEHADVTRVEDPDVRLVAGMETWTELFERIGTALRATAIAHAGETIVVAAHGGPIGASFVELGGFGTPTALDRASEVANTSITEWRHDGFRWRLVRFNDAAHLTL